jgi:hypothetical protein
MHVRLKGRVGRELGALNIARSRRQRSVPCLLYPRLFRVTTSDRSHCFHPLTFHLVLSTSKFYTTFYCDPVLWMAELMHVAMHSTFHRIRIEEKNSGPELKYCCGSSSVPSSLSVLFVATA